MDAKFYSILPSKLKISLFCLNGLPTISELLSLIYDLICGRFVNLEIIDLSTLAYKQFPELN